MTSVAWSSAFVAQSLEVLFVYLGAEGPRHLRPIHADTLRVGWPPDRKPGEIVLESVDRYGLRPLLVHSTSWRHEQGRLILTYVTAVARPEDPTPYLADEPVGRVDLARGEALGPPSAIGVAQVLEHAFRHLSWLVRTTPWSARRCRTGSRSWIATSRSHSGRSDRLRQHRSSIRKRAST